MEPRRPILRAGRQGGMSVAQAINNLAQTMSVSQETLRRVIHGDTHVSRPSSAVEVGRAFHAEMETVLTGGDPFNAPPGGKSMKFKATVKKNLKPPPEPPRRTRFEREDPI